MPFSTLDPGAVARLLALVADGDDDLAEVFFERQEVLELAPPEVAPGARLIREEGLAVRLVRGGATWLAARDGIGPERLTSALRQVARAVPRTGLAEPALTPGPWATPPDPAPAAELARRIPWLLRQRHVAFPLRVTVRQHRRTIQVVGTRLVPAPEEEGFASVTLEMPWGAHGALLPTLDDAAADVLADELFDLFRAREASPPPAGRRNIVLSPAATAVLLHEAVAHALEADTLGAGGRPQSAIGLALAPRGVSVLDDPAGGPPGNRRATDDEGMPTLRRWLLRDGTVEAPLADRGWAARFEALAPGAARRASRHEPPGPRSTHLELLPGEATDADLRTDGALYVPTVRRGRLDPVTGSFRLQLPCGFVLRGGELADPVGPFTLQGSVAELLGAIVAVGRETRAAGAGWCAKGGQRLPVWATAPAIRLAGVEIVP